MCASRVEREGRAIGYFLACLFILLTVFWAYRGSRVGVYSALNLFLVFFFALLITLNYYDVMTGVAGRIIPQISPTAHQAIGVVATFILSFGGLLVLCLAACADRVPIQSGVDMIFGGILGAATGIVCSAIVLFLWFSMPFAERLLPVSEQSLFFPAHRITFAALTQVGASFPGGRTFQGGRFLRDLRYGLTDIPSVGDGFYIASIPSGLSVFFDISDKKPEQFYIDMKKRMEIRDEDLTPSDLRGDKQFYGRQGVTPIFVPFSGAKGVVAVMMDRVPSDLSSAPPLEKFMPDGEVAVAKTNISNQELFLKVYKVQKEGNIGSVIALFEPKLPDAQERQERVKSLLPLRQCFPLSERKREELAEDLTKLAVVDQDAARVIEHVQLGGKALFLGPGNKPMAVEMTGRERWRVFEVEPPIDLEQRAPAVSFPVSEPEKRPSEAPITPRSVPNLAP